MLYQYTGNGKIIYHGQLLTRGDTIELERCDREDFEEVNTLKINTPKKRAKRS